MCVNVAWEHIVLGDVAQLRTVEHSAVAQAGYTYLGQLYTGSWWPTCADLLKCHRLVTHALHGRR
jgi:hypothetical protein